jgi:hypothetical protein
MRAQIIENVVKEINSNPVVSDWIKKDEVRAVTASYLNSLSDDQIIQKSTTNELAVELSAIIKPEIRSSNSPIESDELEATLNRVDTDIRIGVANGICAVTINKGEIIDANFKRVDSELKNLANETVDVYSSEAKDKVTRRLDRTIASIPCGLPVLPPHWIFTINVWTYEVIGIYETFTLIDNDNEVIPKPYFGHKGQKYVRESLEIYDPIKRDEFGYNIKLGDNRKIRFKFNGYATSIVGPGLRGVGDKIGESTEESIAFESLLTEYGV